MQKTIFVISFVALFASANAQNEQDALRYSQLHFGGTARHNGMGGAFGALGGDLSTTNPAGIGVFRKSEVNISPTFLSNSTVTSHYGSEGRDFKLNVNFNNAGYVWSIDANSAAGWQKINIAVGYNQLVNFNNRYYVEGINNNSSIIDTWINVLNSNGGVDPGIINENPQFFQGTNLAWQTFLVDFDTSATSNPYFSALRRYGQTQKYSVVDKGSVGETFFALGANYANKLYLGASVTSPKIRFSRESVYTEVVSENDTLSDLNTFSLNESLNTEGRGYNLRVGAIYKPIDYIRLGASIQTPTYYSLTDRWSTDMTSEFDTVSYSWEDPDGRFNYILVTPFRSTLSAAVQVGKLGLVSADYEIVDYPSARLQSQNSEYSFKTENDAIEAAFRTTGNLKIGTEWRINQFTVRGGFGYFGNPLKSDFEDKLNFNTYSLGAGYRTESFYLDVAYNLSKKSGQFYLYDPALVDKTDTENNIHRITTTVGFRF